MDGCVAGLVCGFGVGAAVFTTRLVLSGAVPEIVGAFRAAPPAVAGVFTVVLTPVADAFGVSGGEKASRVAGAGFLGARASP